MDSFLAAAALRSCAAASGPLPTDDALAALELHGSNICVASTQGSTLWTALLRARGLVSCVELGPLSPVERYNDHLLLLVEPRCDEVLEQFIDRCHFTGCRWSSGRDSSAQQHPHPS